MYDTIAENTLFFNRGGILMNKMKEIETIIERGILVGVNLNDDNFEYSMEELANLTQALEVEVIGTVTQNIRTY